MLPTSLCKDKALYKSIAEFSAIIQVNRNNKNRTTTSIEVQNHRVKEATIIVRGERNNQIMFEEQFDYNNKEKHSLRLHLLKERFMEEFPKHGESLDILCLRKLFNDITIQSKMKANCDYRVIDNYIDRKGNRLYIPKSPSEIRTKFNNDELFFRKSIPMLKVRGHEKDTKRWFGVISVQQRTI